MIKFVRSRWADFRALMKTRSDVGASVVEVAIVAAGLAALAIAVMAAIKTLVDGEIPNITS